MKYSHLPNDKALAVSGGSIFAGTVNGGVYRSTDDGAGRSPVERTITDALGRAVAPRSGFKQRRKGSIRWIYR